MDYQSLTQLMTSKSTLIKKVTPFLLSVSLFSFIFANSSWHSFFVRFFKFYFSSLPMQVLSHALEKRWIFLICNGILVVIVNTSGMVHSEPGSDFNDLLQKKIADSLQMPPATKDGSSEPENAVLIPGEGEEKENDGTEEEEGEGKEECLADEQEENSCLISDDDEQEQEIGFFKTGGGEGVAKGQEPQVTCINGDEENEEDSETCFMMEEEEEEQLCDEEGIDTLSTEELNKKFEDFIRKMKEELRIEAQQHLVMVK